MARSVFVIESDGDQASYVQLLEGATVAQTVELDGRTLVDLDEAGEVVGVEVLGSLRDWVPREVNEGEPGPIRAAMAALAAAWSAPTWTSHAAVPA